MSKCEQYSTQNALLCVICGSFQFYFHGGNIVYFDDLGLRFLPEIVIGFASIFFVQSLDICYIAHEIAKHLD